MSDPGVCPACKGPMKPLFTGFYCPRDCDRPQVQAPKQATGKYAELLANVKKATSQNQRNLTYPWFPPPIPTLGYAPKDTQCRDAMCRGPGSKTHSIGQGTPLTWFDNYRCALCSAEWMIPSPPSGGIP